MDDRPLVAITDYLTDPTIEREILSDHADVRALDAKDEAEVVKLAGNAHALLAFHDIKLTKRSLAQLSECRCIVRCGVGFDNVDGKAAGALGIAVCNVPDYGTEEVADHAVLLLLTVARRLMIAHQAIKNHHWETELVYGTPRLRGRTLGLIGCGRIGTATAVRAKAFGMRVVFYDPYLPAGYDKALGVQRAFSLEELLGQSQFLSLHCPLTTETRHILNPETLSLLPHGGYVVNTARGGCVDLEALADALDNGRVAYAGLDVFDDEPLCNERIRQHSNVVLTPHSAFYSVEGYAEMRQKAAEEVLRMLRGEPLRNIVNGDHIRNPRFTV